jgi:PAS domain S-box-containing protein
MTTSSRETTAEELKRYVRFTDEDARTLVAFGAKAKAHLPRVAQEFYERIHEHEAAHAVLAGEEQIARLQASMVKWLERLFAGPYDASYFARTEHVGRVHVKVGLPQRYMPAAMAVVRSSLDAVIGEEAGEDAAAVRGALSRLLDVELTVMLESYREDLMARVERAARTIPSGPLDRQSLDLVPMIVVALDAAGAIVVWNRAAERVTGYARDEVEGRVFAETILPLELRATHAEALLRPSDAAVEVAIRTRAGKPREVSWSIVGLDGEGPARVLAFGTDVTEARAEAERFRQQERLAAVGTLAAGLAHEIRNPLNGALLHVSFLGRALGKSAAHKDALEAAKVVEDEIKRLARLVTDFLDFAHPRPLSVSSTSARMLCERAAHLVASAASAAKVNVTLDLPASDLVFEADTQRLEQVFLNLLQNAIEALVPHGGHVVLRARRAPHEVTFEVEDDGPGLSAATSRIFDAFYSTKPNGTGLGLAIVLRIVTDHHGTIDVDSHPGRTRFRVKLPLAQQGTRI